MINIISNITSYILGFATAIFAEPIRQKLFGPKLELHFGDTQEYINILPSEDGSNVLLTYIRVRVVNVRRAMAKYCKAYLINIERWDDVQNKFVPSGLKDSIQLAFSCKIEGEEFEGIDLAKGANQFIDVVHSKTAVS